MAIALTDDQLKTVSKEVIQIPDQITALNGQLVVANTGKADALSKDDANKVFYDNFKAILAAYYTEKGEIDGSTYTTYNDTDLDNSAKQAPGNLHFPTSPIWANLQPKIIDSVQGNPTGVVGFQTENATHPKLATAIDELLNGFDDGGSIDDTLYEGYVIGQPLKVDNGGFAPNQRVIVDNAGVSLMGLITAVGAGQSLTGSCSGEANPPQLTQLACEADGGTWTPDPAPYNQELTITVLGAPLGSLPAGSRVRNWHPGFSNSEREGTTVPYAPEAMAYMKTVIDSETNTLETRLTNELAALNANPASGAESTQINTAKTQVQTMLDAIATFEGAPATGAGVGRYGDSVINPYEAARATRQTQASARPAEITTAFGSVTQNPDGSFSGSGNWNSLFKWIDLRTSKAGGSLFTFYNFDLIIAFITQKIVQANSKKAEFDAQLIATKLVQEPTGTNFVKVASATGLSIADTVKVFDDDSAVLTTTIVGVSGQIIELATPVSGLTLDAVARLVKLL